MRAVFETIINISPYLSEEHLHFVSKKINSISKKDYNEIIIKFIKDFTEAALHRVRSLKSNDFEPRFTMMNDEEEAQQKTHLEWIERIEEEIKHDFKESNQD